MYPFLCVFAEQHRRSSGAGLWRTHLLPRCLLLQERWRHPIRPRHLAHVRGAGGGSALLRHLEVPLQRSQLRHPPRLVTATPDRALPVPSPSCSRAERLPRLPAEAATTAVRFTKTMTVNCLLFSNKENRFLSQ